MCPYSVSEFSNNLHLFDQNNQSMANCTYNFNEAASETFFRVKAQWQREQIQDDRGDKEKESEW